MCNHTTTNTLPSATLLAGSEMLRAEKIVKHFGKLIVLNGSISRSNAGRSWSLLAQAVPVKRPCCAASITWKRSTARHIYIEGELIGYREVNGRLLEDREATIAHIRSQIGFVFQRFNLFPHMTALQEIFIEAPIHVLRQPKDEVTERAQALLAKVGLSRRPMSTHTSFQVANSSVLRLRVHSP